MWVQHQLQGEKEKLTESPPSATKMSGRDSNHESRVVLARCNRKATK